MKPQATEQFLVQIGPPMTEAQKEQVIEVLLQLLDRYAAKLSKPDAE